MSNCDCNSDIIVDGSGQLGRYLQALDPAYAPIDERSVEDLLLFAKRYAGQIRFYDIPESLINDGTTPGKVSWREFFRKDMAVIAASVAVLKTGNIKKEYDELRERLDENPSSDKYAALFNIIIGMAVRIDRWYSVAIPENPLRSELDLAINSYLRWQMSRIMAYEDGYKFIDPKNPLNLDYSGIENDSVWGLNEPIDPDASIYQGNSVEDKIRYAALYADDIFNDFFSFLNGLIDKGPSFVSFALEQYPSHQPHMTLFITFLQLFKLAQEQMNGLTGKMLDFYYKDVLQLTPKDSIPDKTHIIFELAKDVLQYDIAKDTALNAGKDASNKEQVYKTATNLVINQAKVKELKTIFIDKNEAVAPATSKTIHTIFANPVANSADGYGTAFTDPNPKWPTFGKGIPKNRESMNPCALMEAQKEGQLSAPPVKTGFAIASPELVLGGGNRIIAVKMSDLNKDISKETLEISLSGEAGWLTIDKKISDKNELIKQLLAEGGDLSTGMPVESSYFFDLVEATLYICLPVVEKAVVPFDIALHPGRNYKTTYPVLQVMMGPVIDLDETVFNSFTAINLSLAVRVGSINVPKDAVAFTLTGNVVDANTNAPLEGVAILVAGTKPPATATTDTAGNFSVPATINNILLLKAKAGYKIQYLKLTTVNPVVVKMEPGDGSSTIDPSIFTIPSFFDGLKTLVLQNDDGLITPNKPFDPFTAYPKPGSALYIGSDEVFNKSVLELAVHIKHLSDTVDAVFDLNFYGSILGRTNDDKKFEFYKLSLLQQKQWMALCTSEGRDFTEGLLTQNVLFKKDDKGTPGRLPPLNRTPLIYSTEFKSQTSKGFLQLQNNIPFDLLSNSNTDDNAIRKDLFQRMAELAVVLKVKEISVSYFSSLQNLDPLIDQFFHVYPFGVAEIYTGDNIDTIPVPVRIKKTVPNNRAGKTSLFNDADKQKGYLLVDANNLLLPQFTYLGPYDVYNKPQDSTRTKASNERPLGFWDKITKSYNQDIVTVLATTVNGSKQINSTGNNQYSSNLQEEGLLFIGLEKAVPLQTLSILFQFAEGSAEDEDNDPPVIHWSYLTNNEWRPMRGEDIISDGTYGFQTTGIVKLNIPAEATNNNTIITEGLHWFCASVKENSQRIPQLINVVTQAVEAIFTDNGNDQSHFDAALPANSITKLAVAVSQVTKVQQPFASFDGKHKEVSKEFYTRVSERLRHKNRAINSWDYEHLVLDRFPTIYKVKCIGHTDPNCLCRQPGLSKDGKQLVSSYHFPAKATEEEKNELLKKIGDELSRNEKLLAEITIYTDKPVELTEAFLKALKRAFATIFPGINFNRFSFIVSTQGEVDASDFKIYLPGENTCCGPQVAPGHVLLVPIPNLKNRNSINPLQPKTSRRVLLEIESYLKALTSPFVKVHAKNPVYEQVIVGFRVKFYTGTDIGFYLKRLNEEIVQYLTPWAFDENADVEFGHKIYASSIINFIEERDYVDFITDFVMGVCKDECCPSKELVVTSSQDDNDSVAAILNKICGCEGIENLLGKDTAIIGEIVARPSTPRSILVSVPQHVIIPYEEPERPTPCELRKQKKTEGDKDAVPPAKDDSSSTDTKPNPPKVLPPVDSIKDRTPSKEQATNTPGEFVENSVMAKGSPQDITAKLNIEDLSAEALLKANSKERITMEVTKEMDAVDKDINTTEEIAKEEVNKTNETGAGTGNDQHAAPTKTTKAVKKRTKNNSDDQSKSAK
ncbi:MAG: hypothetical protein JWP81_1793 [Ferruginibacter sp.]|nr:hypothetical protein [Ferruginibacter sp.]